MSSATHGLAHRLDTLFAILAVVVSDTAAGAQCVGGAGGFAIEVD